MSTPSSASPAADLQRNAATTTEVYLVANGDLRIAANQ